VFVFSTVGDVSIDNEAPVVIHQSREFVDLVFENDHKGMIYVCALI
jgi:hypothetical protein